VTLVKKQKTSFIVYATVKWFCWSVYKICFGFRHYGTEKVPAARDPRGVILAPNHVSYLDPPILGISLKRRVTYLAKDYLFRGFLGWMLRSVGALPIKTGADDFRSIRELVRLLKEGRCIAVFPEGTRSESGELKAPEGGVGFLALKSGAAVVPVYIRGTYEAFSRDMKMYRPHPVRAYYGDPFVPALEKDFQDSPEPYMAVSRRIMAEIAKLKEKVETGKN
jgi:1-acyl-sn-glycerol-3-phosphate acyltransferase